MDESRIIKYWSDFFGISVQAMTSIGISIVPHRTLAGYNGAWIFQCLDRIIFSVPEKEVDLLKRKIKSFSSIEDVLFTPTFIHELFDPKIEMIIGPTFQGYYDNFSQPTSLSNNVKSVSYNSHEKELVELSQSGDNIGWNQGGLNNNSAGLYGYFKEEIIIALAGYKLVKDDVGFIGVFTYPKYRGKGYGQAVVESVVNQLANEEKLAIYQTLMSNTSSKSTDKSIGIKHFATNMAIRFR